MRRKPSTRTASAAAAAAASNSPLPAFTSFAAATAQALNGDDAPSLVDPSSWDTAALSLIRKLSKRDTTTKLRTLADITQHLSALSDLSAHQSDQPADVGTSFVSAWPLAFKAAIEDPSPAVRSAALSLTATIISTFRKMVQAIFPTILPLWLSAQGDANPSVAETAARTLSEVLPTKAHREKVVMRYATTLCDFASSALTHLPSSKNFLSDARRILAIFEWLLVTSSSVGPLAATIDGPTNPLLLMAKGPRSKKASPAGIPAEVCLFAISALPKMQVLQQSDQTRAQRFADICILAIRRREPAGWDLALTLLRNGWYNSFGDQFGSLPQAVCETIAAPVPTGVCALLPLADALPPTADSAQFINRVLDRMRRQLYSGSERDSLDVSVTYALHALSSYVETTSFALRIGVTKWYEEGIERKSFIDVVLDDHVGPLTQHYLAGTLPPVSKVQPGSVLGGPRKRMVSANDAYATELSTTFAILLRGLGPHVDRVFPVMAEHFANAIMKENYIERVHRFTSLLDSIGECEAEKLFLRAVIQAIVRPAHLAEDRSSKALAEALSRAAASRIAGKRDGVVSNCEVLELDEMLLREVTGYVRRVIENVSDAPDILRNNLLVKNVGTVLSWIYWASRRLGVEEVSEHILHCVNECPTEVRYQLFAEAIAAHKTRKNHICFENWYPFCGDDIEIVGGHAANLLGSAGGVAATHLLSVLIDATGGASLSKDKVDVIAAKVYGILAGGHCAESMDSLVTVLIESPLQLLPAADSNVQNVVLVAVLRAAKSESILSAILSLTTQLSFRDAVCRVTGMIELLRKRKEWLEDEVAGRRLARTMSRVIAVVGNGSIKDAVTLSKQLLDSASTACAVEYLRLTPFRFVFGDGSNVKIDLDYLNDVIERSYATRQQDMSLLLEDFFGVVGDDQMCKVAGRSAERFLCQWTESDKAALRIVCKSAIKKSNSSDMFQLIANQTMRFFPSDRSKSPAEFGRIPSLVLVCNLESNSECIESMKEVLQEAVILIRRDATTPTGFTAIDILSTALMDFSVEAESGSRAIRMHDWLAEESRVALQSVRRCFEQSGTSSKASLKLLECHGSMLMSNSLNTFGKAMVGSDDIRFWSMKVKESLQEFVTRNSKMESISSADGERLACISELAMQISRIYETEDLILANDICYWGAWAGIYLIPLSEKTPVGISDTPQRTVIPKTAESSSFLILRAAEQGALLRDEGKIPVCVASVYKLTDFLASSSVTTRKAVLTLLAHTAAIDLPEAVCNSFPEKGFADEKQEVDFVTASIPKQIRQALVWTGVGNTCPSTDKNMSITRELGYFQAWRLFLDLIQTEGSSGRGATGDTEDISFRRVGVTYLRAKPEVYADFFSKCVEVVVDGSTKEQVAAGEAAVEALEAEERAAHGLQLAVRDEKSTRPTSSGSGKSNDGIQQWDGEVEVGRAAGIAFSRALQRLPALSRQHVTDRLDRGTALRVEAFVRKKISPLLIAAEIRRVKEWGAFGGGSGSSGGGVGDHEGEGELHARGSVPGREAWATYTFSDVSLEIGMRLPDVFPLQTAEVEARSRIGMSEARWRKTLLGMTTLLRAKDGTLAEAVELWRRNLDKTFQGAEECPICYSVLHLSTAALPKMQCRTCKNLFHSDCLCKWFTKSNSSACPLCRSAF